MVQYNQNLGGKVPEMLTWIKIEVRFVNTNHQNINFM